MRDVTSTTAIGAGTIFVLNGKPLIAHSDLEANRKGAAAYPNGKAVYNVLNHTQSGDFSSVDTVYVTPAGALEPTDDGGTNTKCGSVVDVVGQNVSRMVHEE